MKHVLGKSDPTESARVQDVFLTLHSAWDNEKRTKATTSSVDRLLAQALSTQEDVDSEGLCGVFGDWLRHSVSDTTHIESNKCIINYVLGVLYKVGPLRRMI